MKDLHILADDPLKRSFVLPQRVVCTTGCVENAEVLLEERSLQISLAETRMTTLRNAADGEKAGVLLDFGRELTGGIRLLCFAVDTPSEQTRYPLVRLRFGESASEAMTPLLEKNTGNDHAVRDFVVPVPALSDQEWGQTGFRFVYIELQQPDTVLCLTAAVAAFARREPAWRGSFRCSDERLNEIFAVSAYTCQLCMQHHLWDGVKRDRLIWIGDSHPEMLTIRSVFGRQPVLEESLDEVCRTNPLPKWMNGMSAYSLWWLRILWDWYMYTGDREYPMRHRAYVQGLVRQVLADIDENGCLTWPYFFLDWPTNNTPAAQDGVQALLTLALEAAENLLTLFGDTEQAAAVRPVLAKTRRYSGKGHGSKAAAAMLYLAGILPAEEMLACLTAGGAAGMSTFMSYYLLTALAGAGETETALSMLRTYYGGMLDMGATTFWEDFDLNWMPGAAPIDRLPAAGEKDIHGDYGNYCYEQFRHSLCHGWSSGPAPFLLETVLGVHFDTPGGEVIRLRPQLGGLTFAEGSYPLPQGGELHVRCEQTPQGVQVQYDAPAGVRVLTE